MTEITQDHDPIALFDLDGSLADYDAGMRRYLNMLRAPHEPEIVAEDSFWELEQLPYMDARMKLIKDIPGFWESLPAAKAIGYDCQVLTKGPRAHTSAWSEKLR